MNAKRILSAFLAPVYTYENGKDLFEKVSHVNTPLGQADGIHQTIEYNGSLFMHRNTIIHERHFPWLTLSLTAAKGWGTIRITTKD